MTLFPVPLRNWCPSSRASAFSGTTQAAIPVSPVLLLLRPLFLICNISQHFSPHYSFHTLPPHVSHTAISRLTQTTHPENLFLRAAGILCSGKADKRILPIKIVTFAQVVGKARETCEVCSWVVGGAWAFLEIWFCYSTVLRGYTNVYSSFCGAIVYLWQVLLDIPHHPRKHKKRKKVMRMNFHVVMYMLL